MRGVGPLPQQLVALLHVALAQWGPVGTQAVAKQTHRAAKKPCLKWMGNPTVWALAA